INRDEVAPIAYGPSKRTTGKADGWKPYAEHIRHIPNRNAVIGVARVRLKSETVPAALKRDVDVNELLRPGCFDRHLANASFRCYQVRAGRNQFIILHARVVRKVAPERNPALLDPSAAVPSLDHEPRDPGHVLNLSNGIRDHGDIAGSQGLIGTHYLD